MPISEGLEKIIAMIDAQIQRDAGPSSSEETLLFARGIASRLLSIVNSVVCVTEPQLELLKLLTLTEARDVTNGLSVDSVASRIAVFVNSLELDCNHCSNGSCGGRDPLKGFTSDGHRPE